MNLEERLIDIIDHSYHQISDMLPSEWAEKRMVFTEGRFPGPLNYDLSPFLREPVNCMSPYHPAVEVALMGPAQIGKSKLIIEPTICHNISEHPCNIGYLTGHSDLSEESMTDLDTAIFNALMQHLIMAKVQKKRNAKTGDTAKVKEYLGGKLVSGSVTNHKLLRQRNWKLIIVDDIDAGKASSKESGSTVSLVRERGKSYGNKKKILWISTPELKETSIIEQLYLEGDQRLWYWPCPCCGTSISLKWSIDVPGTNEKAGVFWKYDSLDRPIPSSIGYVCHECAGFFTEKNKYELNLAGLWTPTELNPINPDMASFKLNGLYAPPGMDDWNVIVQAWAKANPKGQPQNEALQKTWINLKIGESFESTAEGPKATQIMGNIRGYDIGIIPEKMSMADGNGRIVLLTCEADANGTIDDARLDYEVVAWSETGASYSIVHGSIGTFIPREGSMAQKTDRKHWTYEHGKPNSVWPEYDKIIRQTFKSDTGLSWKINTPGVDCGVYSDLIYPFIDWSIGRYPENPCVGMRGDKEEKYVAQGANLALFQVGKHRNDVYFIKVGLFKDILSNYMQLNWKQGDGDQPANFMNFPAQGRYVCPVKEEYSKRLELDYDGDFLYQRENYFEHFEAEIKKTVTGNDGTKVFRWVKKNSAVQNHIFDCRIYNMAKKDIIVKTLGKALGEKEFTWTDYVHYVTS